MTIKQRASIGELMLKLPSGWYVAHHVTRTGQDRWSVYSSGRDVEDDTGFDAENLADALEAAYKEKPNG